MPPHRAPTLLDRQAITAWRAPGEHAAAYDAQDRLHHQRAIPMPMPTTRGLAGSLRPPRLEVVDAQPAARWFQRLQAVNDLRFRYEPAPLLLVDMVFIVIFLPLLR
jgi:hypothetical protein